MTLSIDLRPKSLDEVYGHTAAVNEFKKYQINKKWPKAILLKGMTGIGKSTLAQIIAMGINCSKPDEKGNPCGKCASCLGIINERFDRDTLRLDGGAGGKSDVVDFGEYAEIAPFFDRNKVFIIEEADGLSPSAKNAMLKLLEMPNSNIYFILLSMVNTGIPKAIQDRCQTYNLKPFSVKDTMFALKGMMERLGYWTDSNIPDTFRIEGLCTIAEASNGSIRSATGYLQRCITGEYWTPKAIRENLGLVDSYQVAEQIFNIIGLKKEFFDFIEDNECFDFFNLSYAMLSNAASYRITREAYNEYFEDQYIALNRSPRFRDLLKLFDVMYAETNGGYLKKSYIVSKIAQFYMDNVDKKKD